MRVVIVEPVVPHYRVPLFDRLARIPDIKLTVAASARFPGSPDSAPNLPAWAEVGHLCIKLLAGRLQWQRGLTLPSGFGRGDVLVVDNNPRILSNFPLIKSARAAGGAVVLWGHAWSPTSRHWRAAIRYWLMNRADVLLVYTDKEVERLRILKSWSPPIRATNNALDQEPMRRAIAMQTREQLSKLRSAQGLEGKRILLFCGRLRRSPSTGLDVAIRALARLKDSCHLVVIGNGEQERELRELAQRVGVEQRVTWVGALYEERDLAPWFLNAECFVYPGTIGLSLLHAFGYGLPVITHNRREMQGPEIDALVDGENGLLFPVGDELALAQRISQVLNEGGRQERMSAAARRTVDTNYSMENMAARFEEAVRLASELSRQRNAKNHEI
jgi:glycosyltransferase involved in cell wall biosynthesis